MKHDFGSLNPVLTSHAPKAAARDVLGPAGPISDAYILSAAPISYITGPGGSGKTTASVKKILYEAQRIRPGADGVRRYKIGVWRQKYQNLWAATIPSWFTVIPRDLPGSDFTGSSPRPAQHVVRFQDAWGEIEITAHFEAFGDAADPEDLRGKQYTDVYLNEMSTMPEDLFVGLIDRIGRDPPRSVTGRIGRIFGDDNAPDVTSYCYRDFYETGKDGYVLFRQPGGLDADAENIEAVGREYYLNSAKLNAHRPWWVRRMVHARPGFTRDMDPVYERFDDEANLSRSPLEVYPQLPVLVGIDGGFTPAAVYMQEMADGQLRIFGEVVVERGRMKELGRAMLAFEAAHCKACEFSDACDPAMTAGEGVGDGDELSDRQKLAAVLGRPVTPAHANDVGTRVAAIADKIELNLGAGRPGLLLDARCKALRRGFNQTYHWRRTRGTNDVSAIEKTPDSHPHDAAQYGAMQCGSAVARRRRSDTQAVLERKRQEAREVGRYNPLSRRRA